MNRVKKIWPRHGIEVKIFVLFWSLIAVGGFFIGSLAYAQEQAPKAAMTIEGQPQAPAAGPAPHFKALNETNFHGGEVETPGSVARDFSFINEGEAPLEIVEVKNGCGCLSVSYDPIIQPGGEGHITIAMKIYPEWSGREVRRTTWVMTNDPQNPQIRLTTTAKAAAK